MKDEELPAEVSVVLIHLGDNLPEYFNICVRQIRHYFRGRILACIPESAIIEDKTVERISIQSLNQDRISQFDKTFMAEEGPFWSYTFKRLFVLEEIMRTCNLTDVWHIENDVLIYFDPATYRNLNETEGVYINPVGPKYATYACMHVCGLDGIDGMVQLNNWNLKILNEGKKVLAERYDEGGSVNEMLVAKELYDMGIARGLPTLPDADTTVVFDGSAYGQYVGGTPFKPEPGWAEKERYVGEYFLDSRGKIIWIDGEPYVKDRDLFHIVKIMNLHIHSKQLEKYAW